MISLSHSLSLSLSRCPIPFFNVSASTFRVVKDSDRKSEDRLNLRLSFSLHFFLFSCIPPSRRSYTYLLLSRIPLSIVSVSPSHKCSLYTLPTPASTQHHMSSRLLRKESIIKAHLLRIPFHAEEHPNQENNPDDDTQTHSQTDHYENTWNKIIWESVIIYILLLLLLSILGILKKIQLFK